MKINLIKRVAVSALAVFVSLAMPLSAMAGWGPSRQTLSYNGPGTMGADHVTFNSFTNAPDGDERAFFDGKDATNTSQGGYQDAIQVTPGQELLLRTYIHNNADGSLNASGAGIAKNTKVRILVPTGTDKALRAISYISADNANPGTVTDSVDFQNANQAFSLSYVPGSALLTTRALPGGVTLSDDVVNGGAQIGYDKLDGNVPGCFEYTATVMVKVRVNAPSISLVKKVTTPGSTNWQTGMNATMGGTVSWMLDYTNNSKSNVNHLIVRDTLPAHLKLVPGSVKLIDPNNPNGKVLSDTALFGPGVDAGLYGPNGGGYITYRTTVLEDITTCGNSLISNKGFAKADGVNEVTSSASVTVSKVCAPAQPTTPVTGGGGGALPETGMGTAAGALGTGVLGYAAVTYRKSRKALADALKGIANR